MDAYIKEIYDMLYSPIVSPYNLLENAKLENYSYVKYFTNQHGLVAEMECSIPGEGKSIFFYQFDKKDFLSIIYRDRMDMEHIVFSRITAAEAAKDKYFLNKTPVEKVC